MVVSGVMRARVTGLLLLTALPPGGCITNAFTRAVERSEEPSSTTAGFIGKEPITPADAALDAPDGDGSPVSVLAINDHRIGVDQVLKPIRDDLAERARRMPPAEYGRYLVNAIQARVRTLARDTLLIQEASKDLTEQEESYIADLVDQQIRKQVNRDFAGRQARFERALAQGGSSLADRRAELRRELVITRWLQLTINRRISDPTRDELWSAYASQKDALTKPPRRDMLIIEIAKESKMPEGVTHPDATTLRKCRESALEDARAARAGITSGGAFADEAAKHSTGWHKKSGGRFGWVTRDGVRQRLAPAVEALFTLPDTSTPSDIIETPDAFFIVQAAAIDAGEQPDFRSLQPRLVEHYRQARFNELVEEFVGKLQDDATIRPLDITRFFRAVALAAPQPKTPERP